MPQLRDVKRLGVDASREVVGMTSLGDDRLFVLFSPNRKQIEIYDATAFKLQQTLRVKALGDRNDTSIYNGLTACVDNNCLYISDYNRSLVHKVQLSSDNSIFLFQVSGYPTGGLSVNAMHNILVTSWTVSSGNNLYEYTPVGTLIREIKLEFDFTLRLWHAIELTTDQFVACVGHNRGSLPDYVVELDGRGQVGVNYEGQLRTTRKQQFWWPCHLAVDGNKERIFVADRENNRIVMLNRSAKCAHELTASPDGDQMMAKPQCVYLDESLSRLLVGVEDGRVFVFNARRYKC